MLDGEMIAVVVALSVVTAATVGYWLYSKRHKMPTSRMQYVAPLVIIFVISTIILQKTTWDLAATRRVRQEHHLQQLDEKWRVVEQQLVTLRRRAWDVVEDVNKGEAIPSAPFYIAGDEYVSPTAFSNTIDSLRETFFENNGSIATTFSSVNLETAYIDGTSSPTVVMFNYTETLKYYADLQRQINRIDESISSTEHRFASEEQTILVTGLLLMMVVFSLLLLLWAIMHKDGIGKGDD